MNKPDNDQGKINSVEQGTNLFVWDMRYPEAQDFEGMLLWWGTLQGPTAPPANYVVEMKIDSKLIGERSFKILRDPRSEGSVEDLQAKFEFLLDIRNTLDETHFAITNMRSIKTQIQEMNTIVGDDPAHAEIVEKGKELDSLMSFIEGELYQTKLKSNQDMLNYPIKLNNKLAHLASLARMSKDKPTAQMYAVRDDLTTKINALLAQWYTIVDNDLPQYNELIRSHKINFITVPEK